jgi:hypothetical protein
MLAIDLLKKTLKRGYTVTPITMLRNGTETCFDARPCYGPDGNWLKPHERGEECSLPHVQALRCKNGAAKHSHKDACFHRVHANVDTPGFEIVSADGKFRAKVFADAEASRVWSNPNIVAIPRPPKLKPEGSPTAALASLASLSGFETCESNAQP